MANSWQSRRHIIMVPTTGLGRAGLWVCAVVSFVLLVPPPHLQKKKNKKMQIFNPFVNTAAFDKRNCFCIYSLFIFIHNFVGSSLKKNQFFRSAITFLSWYWPHISNLFWLQLPMSKGGRFHVNYIAPRQPQANPLDAYTWDGTMRLGQL